MEVNHVSGSEPEGEAWEGVDDVRRGSMRYHGTLRGGLSNEGKGKGKEKEKEKGKRRKARERQVHANLEDAREDVQENRKVEDSKERAGRTSSACRWRESCTSMRKMHRAEKERTT